MREHRFVVLVVDYGAQQPFAVGLERRIESELPSLRRVEVSPIVVQQHVLAIACQTTVRSVVMIERKKRVLGIGYNLQKCVTEQRLVECQTVERLTQRVARTIDTLDKSTEQSIRVVVVEALARDIVGLIVDDSTVSCRASRHQSQSHGQKIIVAPTPEFIALAARRTNEVRIVLRGGRQNFSWFIAH